MGVYIHHFFDEIIIVHSLFNFRINLDIFWCVNWSPKSWLSFFLNVHLTYYNLLHWGASSWALVSIIIDLSSDPVAKLINP